MRPHPKAKGNPYQRELMVQRIESGIGVAEAAAMAGWSERTGYKWLRYYNERRAQRALGMVPPITRIRRAV